VSQQENHCCSDGAKLTLARWGTSDVGEIADCAALKLNDMLPAPDDPIHTVRQYLGFVFKSPAAHTISQRRHSLNCPWKDGMFANAVLPALKRHTSQAKAFRLSLV
jgi:hypothetical protein